MNTKIPSWRALAKKVKDPACRPSDLYNYLKSFPEGLQWPLALALSVCKWNPRLKVKNLGPDNCGLCCNSRSWRYYPEYCAVCPLYLVGEHCEDPDSLYSLLINSDTSKGELRYKKIMYNLLVHLYTQAYEAYPNKPKYTLPKGFKK